MRKVKENKEIRRKGNKEKRKKGEKKKRGNKRDKNYYKI